ncbi:MAG: hypothetical protein J6J93_06595 [Muribaculaceae bacterium]|nr:hypothetical protein [Muribaculaceae bacterium]
MKKTIKYIVSAALLLVVFASCENKENRQHALVPVSDLVSLMRDYSVMSSDERAAAYDADSTAVKAFMLTLGVDEPTDSLLLAWSSSRAVEVFTPDVDSVFPDRNIVGKTLGMIIDNAASLDLGLPKRRYAAVVYGRPESVLFVDSVMLIALNHYLGADYPGYSHLPHYQRAVKTPEQLPYDISEALVATEYPYEEGESATLLSRMLYEGALALAKTRLVDASSPATALGYDEDTYQRLLKTEGDIWRTLVENRLLYDISPTTSRKLLSPGPDVNLGNMNVPSRAGRFIGYRIVESYMRKHPETTLSELLSLSFYGTTVPLESYLQ